MVRVETTKQAIELLEKAVEQRGADYVYRNSDGGDGCQYVHQDAMNGELSCGCIVGCALAIHGWTMEELDQCDEEGMIDHIANYVYPDMFGPNVGRVLQIAQDVQDRPLRRGTWGAALAAARMAADLLGL